jgi:hypothetical protein
MENLAIAYYSRIDDVLNDYAQSMFRFERLHPRWIDNCARYLRYVFGDALEGKVFLDYAFGRGNWALAALKAGARQVIAVDAAIGNVRRLADHCRAGDIDRIDIVHGNVMDLVPQIQADVLWVYGILPCVADPESFVARLSALRRSDGALMLLYAYDRHSLRQVIVEAARRGLVYRDEHEFAEDSCLFSPRARLRARDDLTAPVVNWSTAAELAALAERNGCVAQRQLPDFRDWLTGTSSAEFSPHHLLCGFSGPGLDALGEPERLQAHDFSVLAEVARAVLDHATALQRCKIAIGLFNTHFCALSPSGSAEPAIVEVFLYLMHASLRLGVPQQAFSIPAASYYAAAMAAMTDAPRGFSSAQLALSPLAQFLQNNTVRF